MPTRRSALAAWSQDEIALGKAWVAAWQRADVALTLVRREELRTLDSYVAIARICGDADYWSAPRLARPSSGLIEQQRLFGRLRRP